MSDAERISRVPRYVRVREAAELTGLSTMTITRRAKFGDFPNAYKERQPHSGNAPWLIPVDDLQAAGLPLITDVDAEAAGDARLKAQLRYWKKRALEAERLLEQRWE